MTFLQVTPYSIMSADSGNVIRSQAIFYALCAVGETQNIEVEFGKGVALAKTVPILHDHSIDKVLNLICSQNIHSIIFEGVALLSLARAVKTIQPDIRIIFDFHNIESSLLEEQDRARLRVLPARLVALANMQRWGNARDADLEAAKIADQIFVCSQSDLMLARSLGIETPITIVPNPIPQWCTLLRSPKRGPNPRLGFVGHLGYLPNKAAVAFILRDIAPRVKEMGLDPTFAIAGRSPGRRVAALIKSHNAQLLANPISLEPVYRDLDALVIPLMEGGGTRIKVLEALAVGRPIIASSKAIDGIDLVNGKHFLLAQTPVEFAWAISRLWQDPELGQSIASAGREFVIRNYGSNAIQNAIVGGLSFNLTKPGQLSSR